MRFSITQIHAKCPKQNVDNYHLFADLTKSFDTVSREVLWVILLDAHQGFVDIILSMYDDMGARVVKNGYLSDPFLVTNGVMQGCVLESTLFSVMFARVFSQP